MFASVRGMRPRALLVAGLIAITSLSFSRAANAQAGAPNQWTWTGGSDTVPFPARVVLPVYGTLDVFAPGNNPGSQGGAATWTDGAGNLWLFGGPGNVLWEFNPSTSEWAWMGGSSTGQFGVYGALGTPAPENIPGTRFSPATWTDKNGHFWLYGGRGDSADNGPNLWLNDLWEFDPSTLEWTWMGGDSSLGDADFLPAVYGTLGTPATGNNPGSRQSAVSWTDNKGNLWLFGGNNNGQFLNDLWEYNPATNLWAWMGGSNPSTGTCTPAECWYSGEYGTLGTPAAGNNPGARVGASNWTGSDGNFWLFGGFGDDGEGNLGELNDMWEYNPSTNEWAWMSGSSEISVPCGIDNPNYCGPSGVYGTLGAPAAGNVPGGRDAAANWTDTSGNLWLFGGSGYDSNGNDEYLNDLWEFNPSTSEWTWMGGSSIFNVNSLAQYGVYGTLGTPAQDNIPGSRYSALNWTDSNGNFWLFGGGGPLWVPASDAWFLVSFDDLWRYTPSLTPVFTAAPAPTFSVAAGTYTSTQSIAISDVLPGATIYYTTDGSTPTINSNTYTGPLTVSSYSTTETINALAVAPNYFNSTIASATYVINLPASAGTVTLLASSPNPSSVGEYVTFTATVLAVSSSVTPAGTIQFSGYNGSPLGPPVALNSSGVATYTTAALFAGGASITATYTPSSGAPFTSSTSAPVAQIVGGPCPGTSSTTLVSSQNPSTAGQSITFTATVAAGAFPLCMTGGGGAPGGAFAPKGIFGTVQFYVNGTATGPQMPVGGFGNSAVASYSTSTLPSGTDAITALFTEGNGYVESSGSAPLNEVVNSTTENGSFTLTPSTPALTITQGASGSDVITVTDLGGFSGSVDLSVSGLPSGVGAGFSPGPSTGTSELTLTANSTAATGTFTVTITGTSGALTASTTIALTVDVPASFSIAPQAAALSITQGGTGTDTIAVNDAGGFSGSVTLAASGLPVGVTASFDTNPATGNSVLTLAANSAAATGASTVTITGTSGALTASTTISLTVDAPASFTIAAQAAALSITQGGAGTDTIAVDGAGGFSGSVTLAASGLPTGVTASFGTNPATGTSVLTLAANSAAATGVYSLTVTGTSTSTTESASTTIQFAVDSAGASTPSLGVSAATVAAGSSATYPVTLPSNVTSASVACMNLPAGATCSFSSTTNAVTIATSSTTPSGIYQVTVVFTETVTAAASAGLLLPIGLLPLLLLRRRLALRGIWTAACLGLILLAATALSTGCGGAGSTQHPPPSTYQMTSSATVSLTVQ